MTGSVELDPDGKTLLVRFPYREDLVALVKDLPRRRWDPRNKTWNVPIEFAEEVYETFARHLFTFSSQVSQLLAGTLGTPVKAAEEKAPNRDALTVSQLNARVRGGLRELFPEPIWIVGEIVGFDRTAGRQHRFFQLAEKASDQARAKAVVEAVLFGNTASRLLPRLEKGAEPFTLRDGIEVRAKVQVDLYPASGRFQVVVQDIDPEHTLGKLLLTREQILRELREKGLAERNLGLPFPVPSLRIGVLTSPESDGWNDFVEHLGEAGAGLEVTLVPIRVQGAELKPNLLRGLAWFAKRAASFDLLCILRGGGSRTDLAWFDDPEIAAAVATHPLKVVVGIGHQRDQSVLDVIAHSEKTPTAVAGLLAESVLGARRDVVERAERLRASVADVLTDQRMNLTALSQSLGRATRHILAGAGATLRAVGHSLGSATGLRLSREGGELRSRHARLENAAGRTIERASLRLDACADRHRLLDPRRVLDRGFALVRRAGGRIITSSSQISAGASLVVELRDGKAHTHVERVEREAP